MLLFLSHDIQMFTNMNIQQSVRNKNSLQLLDYVNMISLIRESPQDSLIQYIVPNRVYIQSYHLYIIQVRLHYEQ